jgi:hypothetical protein
LFEQGTEGAIDFSQLLNVEIEVDRLTLLVEELLLQGFLFTLFGLQINKLIVPDKPPSSSNDECEQTNQDGYFRYERPAPGSFGFMKRKSSAIELKSIAGGEDLAFTSAPSLHQA